MADAESRVTIHMAASLDGFIARQDGRVDWMESVDEFPGGETLDPETVTAFLATIDCYVMGARTYETALSFEAHGFGWAYGDKPTWVLTHRELPRNRETVQFYSGDLAELVNGQLRPRFRSIWVVGGREVCAECLRRGLADEVRYSILPVLIGEGVPFFDQLGRDVPLHLAEVKAYKSGMVALRYEVRGRHVITTARLALCPAQLAEAAELEALLAQEEVRRYLTDGVAMPREWVEEVLRESAATFASRGLGLWSVREHGAPQIVGLTGFRDFFTPPVFELLFALLPSHWNRGFATEMAQAALDYAFHHTGLEAVRASTDAPNEASLRVLERLGLRPDGQSSQAEVEGVRWDQLHFILPRAEWQGRQGGTAVHGPTA